MQWLLSLAKMSTWFSFEKIQRQSSLTPLLVMGIPSTFWSTIQIVSSVFLPNWWPYSSSSDHWFCIVLSKPGRICGWGLGMFVCYTGCEGTVHIASCVRSSWGLAGASTEAFSCFCFDGEGVLLLADWVKVINLANLLSFELISLWASCKTGRDLLHGNPSVLNFQCPFQVWKEGSNHGVGEWVGQL